MKQIAIISGKGGTGKTSIASAFASLATNSIFADCDVNVPDLHIILRPAIKQSFDFVNKNKVKIDQDECIRCGLCFNICRFDAVDRIRNQYYVREFSCAGCDLCRKACPVMAIDKIDNKAGEYFVSETRFGPLIHSQLGVGEDYSGKLIAFIRDKAMDIAREQDLNTLIIDGPPGVGCASISTITGIDLAVLVTNATQSSIVDLERSIELLKKQGVEGAVIINKSDFNCDIALEMEKYCLNNNITVLGKIPYDRDFTYAMLEQKSIIEFAPESATTKVVREIWGKVVSNQ
jgi:MinD superfamily P-loop ATPase